MSYKYQVGEQLIGKISEKLYLIVAKDNKSHLIKDIDSSTTYNMTEHEIDTLFYVSYDDIFHGHICRFAPKVENKLLWLITGLLEENGELLQILRENEYKGKKINKQHLKEELGDVFYYFSGLLNYFDLSLEEIKRHNLLKLHRRFTKSEYNNVDAIKKADHNE